MKNRIIVALILVFACIINLSYSNEIIDTAKDCFNKNQFNIVIEFLEKNKDKILTSPDKMEYDNLLAWAYYKNGDKDKAFSKFDTISKNKEHKYHIQSIFQCGKISEEKKDLIKASQKYFEIITLFPNSNSYPESCKRFSDIYKNMSIDTKNILNNENKDKIPDALFKTLWIFYNERKNYEKAEEISQMIISDFPSFIKWDDALMISGRAKIKLNKYDDALITFKYLLENTPYNNHWNEAQAEIVRILVDTKRWDKVKEESLILYKYDHPRGRAYAVMSYVNACLADEDEDEAKKYLEKIINESPNDPYLEYYRTRIEQLDKGCCGN